jgi:Kelch motif
LRARINGPKRRPWGGSLDRRSDHDITALVFDLAQKDGRWEELPTPPFRRRALAVASIKGKVYVLGGLTEHGKVVKSVDLYDLHPPPCAR